MAAPRHAGLTAGLGEAPKEAVDRHVMRQPRHLVIKIPCQRKPARFFHKARNRGEHARLGPPGGAATPGTTHPSTPACRGAPAPSPPRPLSSSLYGAGDS